jgi:serine protease Do
VTRGSRALGETAAALLAVLVAAAPMVTPAASAAPAAEAPRAAAAIDEVERAIVQVVTIRRDSETRVPRGSAFFVTAEGHLLTCAHVVDHLPGDEARRLRLRDGSERRFRVVTVDREIDVALLRSDPPERFLALGEATLPPVGEAVVLAGYPVRPEKDGGPRLKPGTVLGLERRRVSGARRAVASRPTILSVKVDEIADAGQSGGPLLTDGAFLAVGIVRANLERETGGLERAKPEGYSVAVPLLYVGPFLRRWVD